VLLVPERRRPSASPSRKRKGTKLLKLCKIYRTPREKTAGKAKAKAASCPPKNTVLSNAEGAHASAGDAEGPLRARTWRASLWTRTRRAPLQAWTHTQRMPQVWAFYHIQPTRERHQGVHPSSGRRP
jgi:hypothetical protein